MASESLTPGRYRLWDGVSLRGRMLYSVRPLSVTRLNEAGVDVVAALSEEFRTPADIASETDHTADAVARLLERLHRRGFLEWAPARDPTHTLPVSIVITVRNAREHLLGCLDALAALDYPAYEVIVVDDGSTDGTARAVRTHPLVDRGQARVVSVGTPDEPLGIGASRNRGVAAASHDVVAFTDADCRPRSGWLTELVPCLAAHDLIGGRVRPHGHRPTDGYEAINSSLDMGAYATRVDPDGATPYLPTANLVGHRTVFETVPFPERNIAEDVSVCWRAIESGFDVVYTPKGVVEHEYQSSLRAFAARRAEYGASEALLAKDFGHGDRVPVSLEPVVLAVTLLVALASGAATVLSLTAIGSVVLLGGIAVGVGRRYRSLRVVPMTAVCRSYGRGILSTGYALSQELTRYYSVPAALGCTLLAAAWPAVGAIGLGTVLAATVAPAAVEHVVHRPKLAPLRYAWFYLADHLGYQHGVYRGAIEHHTIAHLDPRARFRVIGPTAAVFKRFRTWIGPDIDARTVAVGDNTARFRTATSTERWWFDADDLRGERPVLKDLMTNLRADDVVFDIGANVGLYTCFAGQMVGGDQLVAFEPHPTNADRLAANADLNGIDACIKRVALGAVDDDDGQLVVRDDEAGIGDHTLRKPDPTETTSRDDLTGATPRRVETAMINETVESPISSAPDDAKTRSVSILRGDSVAERDDVPHPTVLKIDVEDAELDVLRGLDRTLSRAACRLVYCEIHPDGLAERGVRPADVEQFLEERGFICEPLNQRDGRYNLRARRVGRVGKRHSADQNDGRSQ